MATQTFQSLLDEDSDIDDALLYAEPVPWAKDPLHLTTDECQLRLLHVKIKHRAVVPSFKALPRNSPPRPAQLRLPNSFAPAKPGRPIDFFKLFINNDIIDVLVQNTNTKAMMECAGYNSRQWKPVNRHNISTWLGLTIYIGLHRKYNIKDFWSIQG